MLIYWPHWAIWMYCTCLMVDNSASKVQSVPFSTRQAAEIFLLNLFRKINSNIICPLRGKNNYTSVECIHLHLFNIWNASPSPRYSICSLLSALIPLFCFLQTCTWVHRRVCRLEHPYLSKPLVELMKHLWRMKPFFLSANLKPSAALRLWSGS